MRNVGIILRREFRSYFDSPIAYIFMIVYLLLNNGLYMSGFFLAGIADMRGFFGNIPLFNSFFLPAVAMRLWAEDKKSGTLELLMTLPMRSWEVVLGKYLAALAFYGVTLLGTVTLPITLGVLGNPDPGAIFAGYLGAVLLGAFFLAIGIFVSGLFKDQIAAFLVGSLLCLFFFLVGQDWVAAPIDGWIGGLGSFLQSHVGMWTHFEAIQRGVVDVKNLLYFVALTGLFLVLNTLSLEGEAVLMASRRASFNLTFTATAVLLFAIAVLAVAVLGSLVRARVDLTHDKLYTVSPAAKRILNHLSVPVQVKLYMTGQDAMPTQWKTLERDVVDKLKEFKAASGGKLSFSVIDPTDNDELKEKLAPKGIRPLQVQSIEKDEMAVKLIYSAISVAYKEKAEEVIPQIVPESLETLEYQLCSSISKLTRDKDPIVAVYTSRPEMDPQMRMLYMQMGQAPPEPPDVFKSIGDLLRQSNYDIRPTQITEQSPIPPDAGTLLVLAPRHLDARQRYEINKFVQRGGNAVFAVQRYEYDYSPGRQGGFSIAANPIDTGVDELLDAYGVKVSDKLFMDMNMAVLSIPRQQNMGGFQVQVAEPVKLPVQIRVNSDQLNTETSITNRISEILYLWGNRLLPEDDKLAAGKIELTPLFTSTDEAWEVPYAAGPLGGEAFTPQRSAYVKKAPLAVMLRGDVANPYASGSIPPWSAAKDSVPPAPQPVESFEAKTSNVIVVGCAQMFTDNLLGVAGNAMFLLNAVDAVTLGNDLIEIRSKAITQRAIGPVSPQKKLAMRLFATVFVPVVVAGYGISRMLRRRREEAAYLAAYNG